MKILILGAGGMAGHTIGAYLAERNHDVLGLVRKPGHIYPSVVGDVRDDAFLQDLIRQGSFDAVVNCIGVLNQFAERDQEQAVYLNAYLPHHLARITANSDTRVVHISTDCVFSGSRGGYREEDLRDGTSFYDRTKALGELEDNRNVTLRQSIVGPDLHPEGIGLFNWFMAQHGTIRGYTRALWTGVTTLELAKAVEAAIREKITGLHHLVNQGPISKHDLIQLFKEKIDKTDVAILPYNDVVLDRSLVRTRFYFTYRVPDYRSMVADMADWIRRHRDWYPHYDLGD